MSLAKQFIAPALIALTAISTITPTAAFAARGNDTPGSSGGGKGCDCGNDTPSTSKDGGSSARVVTCGVQKADGDQALYHAFATSVNEPEGDKTTIAVVGAPNFQKGKISSTAIAETNSTRNLTTLTPRTGETLEQCAQRAVGQIFGEQSLFSQGLRVQTVKRGAKFDYVLK